MKITLTVQTEQLATTEAYSLYIKDFFSSLGLDNAKNWRNPREFELDPDLSEFRIFKMPVPIPAELLSETEWQFRVEEQQPETFVFWINGRPLGASLTTRANIECLSKLPRDIVCLAWGSLDYKSEVLPALGNFPQLAALSLWVWPSLKNINALPAISRLTYLDLVWGPSWPNSTASGVDLYPLSKLARLATLRLTGCEALENLAPLKNLLQLTSLDLGGCASLKDLAPLSGLENLQSLHLRGCRSVDDLGPISGLHHLLSFSLTCWGSSPNRTQNQLTDLRPLAGLAKLESLVLGYLASLTSLEPLSGLVDLTRLELTMCDSLKELVPLSELSNLSFLDLTGSKSLSDLKPLSRLSKLEAIFLERCPRIRSLRPLRNCKELVTLKSDLHPALETGVLAHAALSRQDLVQIKSNAAAWMEELNVSIGDDSKIGESLACDLAEAISLPGEPELASEFQDCLANNFPWYADGWEAWFRGTLRSHGFEVFRSRIESLAIAELPPGAISGACMAIADATGNIGRPAIDSGWARQWLGHIEEYWSPKASEIEAAAHYICAALDALGEHQSLERWKIRFARECDISVMDNIYRFLSYRHYSDIGSGKAEAHVLMIESDEIRDPMLATIATNYCWANSPEKALDLLLQIGCREKRNQLAVEMSGSTCFSSSLDHLRSLLTAVGDSPQIAALILGNLKIRQADSGIAQVLSVELEADENHLKALRRERLEKLLVEMA